MSDAAARARADRHRPRWWRHALGGADRAPLPAGVRCSGRGSHADRRGGARRRPRLPPGSAPRFHHRQLRRATALLPRRQHRRAGRERNRQRPCDERRPTARPVDRLHPRGGVGTRRPPPGRHGDGACCRARRCPARDRRHEGRRARSRRRALRQHRRRRDRARRCRPRAVPDPARRCDRRLG